MADQIYFEAEITRLNCEYTKDIEYQWEIARDHQSVDQSGPSEWSVNGDHSEFQRRVLKLKPRSLKTGNYTISLTVSNYDANHACTYSIVALEMKDKKKINEIKNRIIVY